MAAVRTLRASQEIRRFRLSGRTYLAKKSTAGLMLCFFEWRLFLLLFTVLTSP